MEYLAVHKRKGTAKLYQICAAYLIRRTLRGAVQLSGRLDKQV